MTDRPKSTRNPAPKAYPNLEWKRDRLHPGTKYTWLPLGGYKGCRNINFEVSRGFVRIGDVVSAHNGEIGDIRAAASRCADCLRPGMGDVILKALADAEGEG
jgi:hypothetical protein